MQAYWNRFAFVRLVLMMMLGIFMSVIFSDFLWSVLAIFIASLFAYLFILFYRPQYLGASKSVLLGVFAFLLCITIGYLNAFFQAEKYADHHLLNLDYSNVEAFTAVLNSKAKVSEKSYGFEANISAVKINGAWLSTAGKGMLYIEKSEQSDAFQYGDELLFLSGIQSVSPPKNPNEFDYQAYLALSQCYFQQYIKADKVHKLHSDQGNQVMALSFQASQYLSRQLQLYITNKQAYAIANALTLGIKDDLDNELKSAYAAAGAMHVLAVSGLHVGIVFMIVAFAFKRWRNQKWGRWIYTATSLLVLWSFAFITGLSPSVMRAATMFSFVVIAQASRRHTNIYNTLAASAFLLLLLDPYLLFSVGFQLSYLAVFGIVYFQPKIQLLLPIKNKWLDKLWILTSVSIAAQLVTAPLGMLYFHQFPSYFFLSNIIVIPAAFVILNGSLLLLVCSFWAALAVWIGTCLNLFIEWVNQAIFWLQQLPMSTLEGIYFIPLEIMLMYALSIFLALFIEFRAFNYWLAMFIGVLLLSSSIIFRKFDAGHKERLMVHTVPNLNVVSYVADGESFLNTSSFEAEDSAAINYHVMPYLLASGTSLTHIDSSFSHFPISTIQWHGMELMTWQGKSIAYVHQSLEVSLNKISQSLNIDYLILSNNVWQESSVIFELFSPQLVIIDGSNSYYQIKKLQQWLTNKSIKYYTVPEEGAFEFKI